MYTVFVNHTEEEHIVSSNNKAYIYNNYEFWNKIISWSINRADTYQFRLWETDLKEIRDLSLLGEKNDDIDTKEIVYSGNLNDGVSKYLLEEYLTEEGAIKFFTIFFEKEGNIISSLSHYGHEIHLEIDNIDEAKELKKRLDNEFIEAEILEYTTDEEGFISIKEVLSDTEC